MPGEKKLYKVDVRFSFYAVATSEQEALLCAEDALGDEYLPDCGYATEVRHSNEPRLEGWEDDCLVYHDGYEDLYLGELLEKLPARAL